MNLSFFISIYFKGGHRLQNSRFFFLKISKEIGKAWRKSITRASLTRPFSASFQTFRLTARAYLNTQNDGLFCSLGRACLANPFQGLFLIRRIENNKQGQTSRRIFLHRLRDLFQHLLLRSDKSKTFNR